MAGSRGDGFYFGSSLSLYMGECPHGVLFFPDGQKEVTGKNLPKTAATWKHIPRTSADVRSGTGSRRRGGPAGNIFWRVFAAVFLCHAGTYHVICCIVFCQLARCSGFILLCAAHSGGYRSRADLGQKTIVKILGKVYGTGRHVPRKFTGVDDAKNLSSGSLQTAGFIRQISRRQTRWTWNLRTSAKSP